MENKLGLVTRTSGKPKLKALTQNKLGLGIRTHFLRKYVGIIFLICMLYCLMLSLLSKWSFLPSARNCATTSTIINDTLRLHMSHVKREKEIMWLMALWEATPPLNLRTEDDPLVEQARRKLSKMTSIKGPHLEDCKAKSEEYRKLDSRDKDGKRPLWGELHMLDHTYLIDRTPLENIYGNRTDLQDPVVVPWVEGMDEDNLIMTRRVQHDLWLLQHPKNCSEEGVRFLVAGWVSHKKHGFGAQLHHMQGMLAIAIEEERVLVTYDNFEFAHHRGCHGLNYKRWSCYFLPETSLECRRRAEELMMDENAIADKKVVIMLEDQWKTDPPTLWGAPWEQTYTNIEVEGRMLLEHEKMASLWWRAQGARYLMRLSTEYTCMLMNEARHEAFGAKAAANVLESQFTMEVPETKRGGWLWSTEEREVEQDMEKGVWKSTKPWIPRPLISVHVRIGDKSREMTLVSFAQYMALANRVRNKFPHVHDIWLSTEMQHVIDESKHYPGWNFYYTKVARQDHRTRMPAYLESLGAENASNMSVVNLLMAADADYFVGAFGSTWCYLINHLKSTSGKLNSRYLSVNSRKTSYW